MARDRDEKGPDKGRVKVRFIEFEMEGSNQTLRENIRDIVAAIGRAPQQPARQTNPALANAGRKGNGETETIVVDAENVDESPAEERADDSEDEAPQAEQAPRKRRFKSPKIVQVELREGEMPLKQFLQTIAPDSDAKKYTLIAYWFKKYRNVEEVTPDHVFTAYMEMGWTTLPKDSAAPLRSLKADGWFEKGQGELAYALNHIGLGKAMDLVNKATPSA